MVILLAPWCSSTSCREVLTLPLNRLFYHSWLSTRIPSEVSVRPRRQCEHVLSILLRFEVKTLTPDNCRLSSSLTSRLLLNVEKWVQKELIVTNKCAQPPLVRWSCWFIFAKPGYHKIESLSSSLCRNIANILTSPFQLAEGCTRWMPHARAIITH